MRYVMFIATIVACALALAYGVLGSSPTSSILGAIWALVAVVAAGFRGVLDALHASQGGGAEPSGEPGDRGGARMPGWLADK